MKILAIRGCNLASLEGEFEVDFRSEPLRSAGLFAITGNTGAGKTTILDAMCITLYKRSPRLENVKRGTKVEGAGASTVSESDVRTILQRGKHKGYAEVDFLAVDGNEYRARWSVSRAHNSPTGNLSAATQDLTNLTTGTHRKLSANEAKTEIPRLVGLEYEQFTRAVLLAQGNFSAFIKAEENEKAQMLEKLTDTGIYSRISASIYSRTQEVKKDVELIEAKRQSLQLLSDEELTELSERKQELLGNLDENRHRQELLKGKNDWLIRFNALNEQIRQADRLLESAKEKLHEAEPVAERLKQIDSVQEIRDDYMSLRSLEKQSADNNSELAMLEKQLEGYNADYGKICSVVESVSNEQEKINAEYLNAQPRITEAVQLEKQLSNDLKRYEEQNTEIGTLHKEREKIVNYISSCKNESTVLSKESEEKSKWIENHSAYSETIPMIPSIIANIKFIGNENMSMQSKKTTLAQAMKLYSGYEEQLVSARQSEELLKQTMSSEIAVLRKRLVDGEPCPVCGSRHHEIVEIATNLLEEKQLEKAKADNRLLIEHLEKSFSDSKNEIDTLRVAIEQHEKAIVQYKKANIDFLAGVDNANELLDGENVVSELNGLFTRWNSYKERLTAIGNEQALITNKLQNSQNRLDEIDNSLNSKREKNQLLKTEIDSQKDKLLSLLGKWESADALLQYYNKAIADINKAFVSATDSKSKIDVERNRLKGEISGKAKLSVEISTRIATQTQIVNTYLAARKDCLKMTKLDELLTIEHASIAAMRTQIDTLEKNVTAAEATLRERTQNLKEHHNATIKPLESEDATFIQNEITSIEKCVQDTNEQIIRINAQLLKDEKNRAEFKEYSKEYEEKMLQMSHWSTLCNMFGSSNGTALMKLAQGYTLDILLDVANVHLAEMTKRYRLARIADDNLGIKVIDLDMMSESRSAHTLSGGETFIVSLALSLALSSLSSSYMSIESLFIDEGFGALDKDTLQTALMVLEKLQSRGRKIGVISHLSEMLEQIPVKVNVKKVSPGKSKIEIIENRK